MSGLAKFFGYLFTGQLGKIASALAERTPLWLYHRWDAALFETTLSGPGPEPALPPGYHCRVAETGDLGALSQVIGLPLNTYQTRFETGDFCFAVFEGKRPANLNWIHLGPCYVRGAGYTLEAEPDDAYIYGIYTDPSERGKGLYKKCLMHLANDLFARGSRRLIQMVENGNEPVWHTLPQLGYQRTVSLKHRRFCGIMYTRWTDASGRVQRRWFCSEPKGIFPI